MKSLIKSYYQTTEIGFYLIQPFALIYQFFLYKKFLSRQAFVKSTFKQKFGYHLNLQNPQTLNEKINWLKLNYWHPLATQFADKYAIREYIAETIGEKYLIPLLFTTKNPRDIVPANLPEEPFIIKTNHDSSGGIIIRDKNAQHNWKEIQSRLRANMSRNFYWDGRERQYRNIEPRIVVEKLLIDKQGNIPADYKVHCFNGKVRIINVDVDRDSENQYRQYYNQSWEKEPFQWSSKFKKSEDSSRRLIPKPLNLNKMISLSEKLVDKVPYLRVDWYILENQLYFGELTFHHIGGTQPFDPPKWDLKLGQELQLPKL